MTGDESERRMRWYPNISPLSLRFKVFLLVFMNVWEQKNLEGGESRRDITEE